ncbi:hypothetical protein BU16DRAFT_544294 [Lophium mytilinum]|uniref:Uncharacterized protein n=1 Tax=Lophium mytilinum TaxID=390894 RepID=A0A6A6QCT5_9PEZI|nr:hypothetical protein BU16DRAFT_544294 [Lophium mytilinum]
MAKDDWAEWIQPWNWTVQARNSTSDVQKASKAVKCQHPSRYIGLLFVDNFAAVLGIILLGLFKSLAISRSAQDRRNLVWRFLASKPGPVTQSILMGFVTAGINVVMNFANAYKIHHYSGYHHVPLVRLWLLFCSRPTLNWLPVVLGLPFSGLFQNIHARDTWLDIASTAAISELLMQGFGTFTFWNATHLGVKRHFYLRNTLRQFWHGTNAHQMYIGSLLWVMGCLVIIPTWLFVLAFIVQLRRIIATLGNAGRRTRTRLWAFLVVVLWTTPSRIVPAATRQRLRRRYDAFAARVNQRLRRGFAPLGRPSRRVAALYAAWRARHPARPRDPQARMREWYARVPIAMVFALLLGLADYIAQILFWDGFVKAEGIRYCPPDQVIPEIVSIWTTGSIAAVLFTFLGN